MEKADGVSSEGITYRRAYCHQLIATILMSVSLFVVGNSVAWSVPVLHKMQYEGQPLNITSVEETTLITSYYFATFIAAIPSGFLADVIGRKRSMIALTTLPISSYILSYFAVNVHILEVARFLIGMFAGSVFAILPLYIGEISEPKRRGGLASIMTTLLNGGTLLIFFIGPRLGYWTLTIILAAISVGLLVGLFFIPESPVWLMSKGKKAHAWMNILWLRSGYPEQAVHEELNRFEPSGVLTKRRLVIAISSKAMRKSFITVEVLSFCQRCTGVSAVIGFSSITLPNVRYGVIGTQDVFCMISTLWLLVALLNPLLADRFGRRPLLIASSLGLALTVLSIAIYFFIFENTVNPYDWIIFSLYALYGVFYNVGVGPAVLTIQGEMFPAELKGVASGITGVALAASSALTTAIYLPIKDSLGVHVNFVMYCAVSISITFFTWFYVIETKGKSLTEIQTELQGNDSSNLEKNKPVEEKNMQ